MPGRGEPLKYETGTLTQGVSYARAGDGPRSLVVIPGIEDSTFAGRYPTPAALALRQYFSRVAGEYTVYLLSRPRGLPEEFTAREGARIYAAALDAELGTVDLLGVSLGGLIALELAAVRPELVDRLVAVSSGCRLAEEGREKTRHLRQRAKAYDWEGSAPNWCARCSPTGGATSIRPGSPRWGWGVLPKPAVPSDVWNSLHASLTYDSTDYLAEIESPTLVLGGERDPFFPEPILRETVAGLPDATLEVVPGAKHGAFHEQKSTFDERLATFLDV